MKAIKGVITSIGPDVFGCVVTIKDTTEADILPWEFRKSFQILGSRLRIVDNTAQLLTQEPPNLLAIGQTVKVSMAASEPWIFIVG
jgi:hypothetical protein